MTYDSPGGGEGRGEVTLGGGGFKKGVVGKHTLNHTN